MNIYLGAQSWFIASGPNKFDENRDCAPPLFEVILNHFTHRVAGVNLKRLNVNHAIQVALIFLIFPAIARPGWVRIAKRSFCWTVFRTTTVVE